MEPETKINGQKPSDTVRMANQKRMLTRTQNAIFGYVLERLNTISRAAPEHIQ